MYHASGKKTFLVQNKTNQKICKAIIRSSNSDKLIVDAICKTNPLEIVNWCRRIIEEESACISKRGSGTVLQKKTTPTSYFNWDDFNDELKAKYPALLSIVNSMVSNVPIIVPGKPFIRVLMTSAIGLHDRNQEMSMVGTRRCQWYNSWQDFCWLMVDVHKVYYD